MAFLSTSFCFHSLFTNKMFQKFLALSNLWKSNFQTSVERQMFKSIPSLWCKTCFTRHEVFKSETERKNTKGDTESPIQTSQSCPTWDQEDVSSKETLCTNFQTKGTKEVETQKTANCSEPRKSFLPTEVCQKSQIQFLTSVETASSTWALALTIFVHLFRVWLVCCCTKPVYWKLKATTGKKVHP